MDGQILRTFENHGIKIAQAKLDSNRQIKKCTLILYDVAGPL